jgi:N6-adenosine-specific RNA methylase IME4
MAPLPLPPGPFATIVADPPWQYTKANLDSYAPGAAEGQYNTMPVSEIAELAVADVAADNAHLYLWVTNPVLTEQRIDMPVMELVRAWGFVPKTILTWVKSENGAGMGFFFRGDTEHVIFAVRGRLPIDPSLRRSNVLRLPKRRHSAKPGGFYDLVTSVSPGPYLEMFSRLQRPGWEAWGDEVIPSGAMF